MEYCRECSKRLEARWEILRILFVGRLKDEKCLFHYDNLPQELFEMIVRMIMIGYLIANTLKFTYLGRVINKKGREIGEFRCPLTFNYIKYKLKLIAPPHTYIPCIIDLADKRKIVLDKSYFGVPLCKLLCRYDIDKPIIGILLKETYPLGFPNSVTLSP